MAIALTSLSHGAGCGCKLSAADLRPIVASLARPADPRVLVAADTADDAGVIALTPDLAIVQTVDFFTPIVDDPYWFGSSTIGVKKSTVCTIARDRKSTRLNSSH